MANPVDRVDDGPTDRRDADPVAAVDQRPAESPPVDPEFVERLRRSGIRIDREGEFQHEGEPVRHEGLRQALFRWLDRLPDGRIVLRLDAERFAYVDVDDTPLVVRAARIEGDSILGDSILLALSDGTLERLDPRTLTIDDAGVMRCMVRNGRLEARVSTSAAAVMADTIDDRPNAGAVITLGGARFPLGRRSATAR